MPTPPPIWVQAVLDKLDLIVDRLEKQAELHPTTQRLLANLAKQHAAQDRMLQGEWDQNEFLAMTGEFMAIQQAWKDAGCPNA